MQKVKIDTASSCFENGIGPQMINIYKHRHHKNEPRFFPLVFEKYIRNQTRHQKMQEIMNDELQYFYIFQLNFSLKKNQFIFFYIKKSSFYRRFVTAERFELSSLEPKSNILSVELCSHFYK